MWSLICYDMKIATMDINAKTSKNKLSLNLLPCFKEGSYCIPGRISNCEMEAYRRGIFSISFKFWIYVAYSKIYNGKGIWNYLGSIVCYYGYYLPFSSIYVQLSSWVALLILKAHLACVCEFVQYFVKMKDNTKHLSLALK